MHPGVVVREKREGRDKMRDLDSFPRDTHNHSRWMAGGSASYVGVLCVGWAVWLGACKRQRKPISALPDTQLIIPSLSTPATPH